MKYEKKIRIRWRRNTVTNLPSRNKSLAMAVKNYTKADAKVSVPLQFCFTSLLSFIYFVRDIRSFCHQGPRNKCWISLVISNLKWIGGFLRSTGKKTRPLNSNTIIWDRIFVSLPSKYWLLLLMKLIFLEFLNDSKILIKQWKPKRFQFFAQQLIMICNKNFNNAGYKHNSDLINLLSSCFFNNLFFTFVWDISSHLSQPVFRQFLWTQDILLFFQLEHLRKKMQKDSY